MSKTRPTQANTGAVPGCELCAQPGGVVAHQLDPALPQAAAEAADLTRPGDVAGGMKAGRGWCLAR